MKCCDAQNYLLVSDEEQKDYVGKKSLAEHLLNCVDCRAFEKKMQVLQNISLSKEEVPEVLWQNLKQQIEAEGKVKNQVSWFFDILLGRSKSFIPIFALSLILILVGLRFYQSQSKVIFSVAQNQQSQQIIVEALSAGDEAEQWNNVDFGSSLEKVFLSET